METSDGYLPMPDGVRLYYRKLGTGPEVLIPNGLYLAGDFERFAARRTLIFYDVRNRGRSDTVTDPSKLARGVDQDADDLDAVRRHFGIERLDAIAHSYVGVIAGLYAREYPAHVNRIIMIGPMQPNATTKYPAHLTNADATLAAVLSRLAELQENRSPDQDPQQACEKFWSALAPIYVADPADAAKIKWSRCDLPNERSFMSYFNASILPSIQRLRFSLENLAAARAPVLVIHGVKDRSAPFGGGLDWAMLFPNARLLTVEKAAHAPWIEAPELVYGAIEMFLDGQWPAGARKIKSLDPAQPSANA